MRLIRLPVALSRLPTRSHLLCRGRTVSVGAKTQRSDPPLETMEEGNLPISKTPEQLLSSTDPVDDPQDTPILGEQLREVFDESKEFSPLATVSRGRPPPRMPAAPRGDWRHHTRVRWRSQADKLEGMADELHDKLQAMSREQAKRCFKFNFAEPAIEAPPAGCEDAVRPARGRRPLGLPGPSEGSGRSCAPRSAA